VKNISTSADFDCDLKQTLEAKIDFLGLDNIILVDGAFENTMISEKFAELRLMAILMDCDLYNSYLTTLKFGWPKLVDNGYIFLDEYYSLKFAGARSAVDEFFEGKLQKPLSHATTERDFDRNYIIK